MPTKLRPKIKLKAKKSIAMYLEDRLRLVKELDSFWLSMKDDKRPQ